MYKFMLVYDKKQRKVASDIAFSPKSCNSTYQVVERVWCGCPHLCILLHRLQSELSCNEDSNNWIKFSFIPLCVPVGMVGACRVKYRIRDARSHYCNRHEVWVHYVMVLISEICVKNLFKSVLWVEYCNHHNPQHNGYRIKRICQHLEASEILWQLT